MTKARPLPFNFLMARLLCERTLAGCNSRQMRTRTCTVPPVDLACSKSVLVHHKFREQYRSKRLGACASAALQPGLSRRWTFAERQELKSRKPLQQMPQSANPPKTEIFVMLPMDIIAVGELREGHEASFIHAPSHDAKLLDRQLSVLRRSGAHGVMLDVWWGICERHGPQQYDFGAYVELFKKARKHGLKIQAVMSFHAGGGNVGDGSCDIPLPHWVLQAGEEIEDEIFYTDKKGGRDHECLSLGCDHEPVLAGRTPLQAYADFVAEFAARCREADLWGSTVAEICIGAGPCGELRYPAYQEKEGQWSFFGETLSTSLGIKAGTPGIGELQCYDRFMLEDLQAAAERAGEPEWGVPPKDAAGSANFAPWETEFFALTNDAGWLQPYGQFFLGWYSGKLTQHCGDLADAILPVLEAAEGGASQQKPVDAAVKVAGIHWWYRSRSHAAEMTAGYFNHLGRNGYEPIVKALKDRGVGLSFTCIEMSDSENPDVRHTSPEELVRQVIGTAETHGVQLLAENALEGGLYSQAALNRMRLNAEHFDRITLLRLKPTMFVPDKSTEGLRVREPLEGFLKSFRST